MQQLKQRWVAMSVCCVLISALVVAKSRAQDAPMGVCRTVGRLACDLAPSSSDPKALCAQLTACLENRRFAEGVVKDVVSCEPLAGEAKLSDAPVHALAAVSAMVESADQQQFYATYLVGSTDQGWCVMDELLDPSSSPNGCDATVRITSRRASHEVTVSAQRTCYDTRDQEELAHGESNVRSVACVQIRYATADGRVRRLEFNERDGPCSAGKSK